MTRILDFVASVQFLGGVAVSLVATMIASVIRRGLADVQWRVRRKKSEVIERRQLYVASLVRRARASEKMLLSQILHEMRARFRAHTWLLLSFFVSAMSAFGLFFYLGIESALTIPASVSLGLVILIIGAAILFTFSLTDERAAAEHCAALVKILEAEEEEEEVSPPNE